MGYKKRVVQILLLTVTGCTGAGDKSVVEEGHYPGLNVTPVLTLSTTDAVVYENFGTAAFSVVLSKSYESPITVTLSSVGTATLGTDFTITPSISAPITIGVGELSKVFSITLMDDDVSDHDETIQIKITAVSPGEIGSADTVAINLRGPTLNFNFADLFNDGTGFSTRGSGYSNLTFSRNSIGSYYDADGIMKYASANIPRFEHTPGTGEPYGLLIENAATNTFLNSQDFSSANCSANRLSSVGVNSEYAPDGTRTVDKLNEGSASGSHSVNCANVTGLDTSLLTFSVFLKPNERTEAEIAIASPGAGRVYARCILTGSGSVSTGVVSTAVAVSAQITALPNNWYRCSITGYAGTQGIGVRASIFLVDAFGNLNYAGTVGHSFYVWGAQLEAGREPTSYIPVTTTAVTRSADVVTVSPLSGVYSATESSILSNFKLSRLGVDNTLNQVLFNFDDGSANNRIEYVTRSLSTNNFIVTSTDSSVASSLSPLHTVNSAASIYQLGTSFKDSALKYSFNGNAVATDASFALPIAAMSRLTLGLSSPGNHALQGSIGRFIYFPEELSSTMLRTWSGSSTHYRALTPRVSLPYANLSARESYNATASFVVGLSSATTSAVTVDWNMTGTATLNTDYTGTTASGTLTFAAGETRKVIRISLVSDGVVDAGETAILTLSNPTNATLGTISSTTMTISDP